MRYDRATQSKQEQSRATESNTEQLRATQSKSFNSHDSRYIPHHYRDQMHDVHMTNNEVTLSHRMKWKWLERSSCPHPPLKYQEQQEEVSPYDQVCALPPAYVHGFSWRSASWYV